ncbi:MAG: redoxin family protein [Pyrinomonadaceae bacterium]|nr:redoxin family protein [Pyrinomonadaceae bacterium]
MENVNHSITHSAVFLTIFTNLLPNLTIKYMVYKSALKIIFLSFFLTLLISPVRSGMLGIRYSLLVGFIFFFYLTIFCLKKYNLKLFDWHILIALTIGLWIIQLPIRIFNFEQTLISLPDVIMHTLAIICGYFYWQLKNPYKFLSAFFGCLLATFMFFQGYDLWIHKLNFGTFTGKVNAYNLPTKLEGFNEQKNFITEKNFQNKIVLLDFWTTTCGICFEKFPQVQTVFDRYKNDSSVMILAVNSPIEEDKSNQAFEMIKEEGHSFPVIITKDADLAEKFGVKGYPTTFVINQNGQIVYKGDIEGAVKMVDELKSNSR